MALAIDATVGGANSNSYVTVAEADAEMEYRIDGAGWIAESDADKKIICLVEAMRKIDANCFYGVKADEDQARAFPRYFDYTVRTSFDRVYSFDSVNPIIPNVVKLAQILEANEIYKKYAVLSAGNEASKQRAELISQGVKKIDMGDVSEEYDLTYAENGSIVFYSTEAKTLLDGVLKRTFAS